MKSFKCACCILSCVVSCALKAEAQERSNADSVLNTLPVYNDYNEMYKSNAHLLHGDTARIGLVSLNYMNTSGSFHKSQEAHTVEQLSFKAKGVATLKKIKLSGHFAFQQSWLDSLNNTMSGTFDHFIPYYFFATKHGKYEVQKYTANTQIAYAFIPEKFSAGIGIDYNYNWMTRSVDPRPEVHTHNITLKPEIIAHLGKHILGVQGQLGYGSDMTQLKFKNTLFTQSLAYPDRIYYNNQGFGYISIKDPFMQIYRTNNLKGAQLSYNYKSQQLDIHTRIGYQKMLHQSSQSEALTDNRIINSVFNEQKLFIDGIATYQTKSKIMHQVQWDYNTRTGRDWNIAFKGNSYNATQTFGKIGYLQYFNRNKYHYYWGIDADYFAHSQTDAAASHSLQVEQITPTLTLGSILFAPKASYELKISGAYTHPLSVAYRVPATQENVFSKHILYPDYAYYSSALVHLGANFRISIGQLIAGNALNIVGGMKWTTALENTLEMPKEMVWKPIGNRLSFNLGFLINM